MVDIGSKESVNAADYAQQSVEILFDSICEKDILEDFCSYVQDKDPDILVYVGDHYADTILDYLFARMVKLGLELDIGREKIEIALLTHHLNIQE